MWLETILLVVVVGFMFVFVVAVTMVVTMAITVQLFPLIFCCVVLESLTKEKSPKPKRWFE
jgi:amino acid transporter